MKKYMHAICKTVLSVILLFNFLINNLNASGITYQKTFTNGPNSCVATSLLILEDGRIIVGGSESNDGTGHDQLLMELSPMGQILSQETFGNTSQDQIYRLIDYQDGIVTAVGAVKDIHGGSDHAIFQYDYNLDSLLWTKVLGGATWENYRDAVRASNGDIYGIVSSYSFPSGNWNPLVYKIDNSGNIIWKKKISGSGIDRAFGMSVTNDGGIVVTGFTMSNTAYVQDMFLTKLDSSGTIEWSKNYDYSAYDQGKSVIQMEDGGFVIGGNISGTDPSVGTLADFVFIKTDSVGNVEYNVGYSRTNRDIPERMIRRSNGNYVIAGYTESGSGGGEDAFALEIDPNGNVVWGNMYGGSGDDYFYDVKESNGDLVFSGYSESFNSSGNREAYIVRVNNLGESGCNQYAWSDTNHFDIWQGNSSFTMANISNESTFSGHYTPNMGDSVICGENLGMVCFDALLISDNVSSYHLQMLEDEIWIKYSYLGSSAISILKNSEGSLFLDSLLVFENCSLDTLESYGQEVINDNIFYKELPYTDSSYVLLRLVKTDTSRLDIVINPGLDIYQENARTLVNILSHSFDAIGRSNRLDIFETIFTESAANGKDYYYPVSIDEILNSSACVNANFSDTLNKVAVDLGYSDSYGNLFFDNLLEKRVLDNTIFKFHFMTPYLDTLLNVNSYGGDLTLSETQAKILAADLQFLVFDSMFTSHPQLRLSGNFLNGLDTLTITDTLFASVNPLLLTPFAIATGPASNGGDGLNPDFLRGGCYFDGYLQCDDGCYTNTSQIEPIINFYQIDTSSLTCNASDWTLDGYSTFNHEIEIALDDASFDTHSSCISCNSTFYTYAVLKSDMANFNYYFRYETLDANSTVLLQKLDYTMQYANLFGTSMVICSNRVFGKSIGESYGNGTNNLATFKLTRGGIFKIDNPGLPNAYFAFPGTRFWYVQGPDIAMSLSYSITEDTCSYNEDNICYDWQRKPNVCYGTRFNEFLTHNVYDFGASKLISTDFETVYDYWMEPRISLGLNRTGNGIPIDGNFIVFDNTNNTFNYEFNNIIHHSSEPTHGVLIDTLGLRDVYEYEIEKITKPNYSVVDGDSLVVHAYGTFTGVRADTIDSWATIVAETSHPISSIQFTADISGKIKNYKIEIYEK